MNLTVTLEISQSWNNNGNGKIKVENTGSTDLDGWSFNIQTKYFKITEVWGLTYSNNNMAPSEWNKKLLSGKSVESGFAYKGEDMVSEDMYTASSSTDGVIIKTIFISPPGEDIIIIIEQKEPIKTSKVLFGYFSEWSIYSRKFSVEQIPVHNLTHVVYAFMLPNPSQEDFKKAGLQFPPKPYRAPPAVAESALVFHDEAAGKKNIAKLKSLKQKNPHIKVLISIGGWSLSWTFSKIAATPELRKALIDSAVKFVIDNGFDGIDIDWEFVGKQGIGYNYVDEENDGKNLIKMLKEMREALDKASPDKYLEITAATGCDPKVLANYKGTEPYMDYLLLMSYDFAGAWDTKGGHLSGLYDNPVGKMNKEFNCHAAVLNSLKSEYPSNKICMGCPMYGRGWEKITPDNQENPIFGKASGAGSTISGSYGESGVSSWRDIRDAINKGDYKAYEDPIAKTAYCVSKEGKTWTYDSPKTAQYKAQYVLDNNLGGMLFWELSDDTRDGKDNILDAVIETFSTEQGSDDVEEIIHEDADEIIHPDPIPEPIPEPTPEPIPEPIPEPTPEPIPEELKTNMMHVEDITINNSKQIDDIIKSIKEITGMKTVSYLLSYSK